MFFFRSNKLVLRLKYAPSSVNVISYTLGTLLFCASGLTVATFFPLAYKLTFGIIKSYLEKKAHPSELLLQVYSHYDILLLIITIITIFIGIIWCYWTNRQGDNKDFYKRFISLSWTTNFTLIVISIVLFFIVVTIMGAIFIPKLLTLTKTTPTSPSAKGIAKPFSFIFGVAKKVNIITTVMDKLKLLKKASDLFDQINQFSYLTYLLSYSAQLISLLMYFFLIKKKLTFISTLASE